MTAKTVQSDHAHICHNNQVREGFQKFEILSVLRNDWEGYDSDVHWKGSFVVWKISLAKKQQDHHDSEGISPQCARTFTELGLKRGTKKKRNEDEWKVNKKKRMVQSGAGKEMKEPCAITCRLKCNQNIPNEVREDIFKSYWGLKEIERKWDFHAAHVKNLPKQRTRQNENSQGPSKRSMTKKYFLNGMEVCKTMYLNTICVSEQVVKTAISKLNPITLTCSSDTRGGNRKPHTESKEKIMDHIRLFPTVDSHYCRKEKDTRYLSQRLSVKKMYELYCSWCSANDFQVANYHFYLKVFKEEFNLLFFKPKKDHCSKCHSFEESDVSGTEKNIIFREEDALNKMSLDDLKKYDIENVVLFPEGRKSSLPNGNNAVTYVKEKVEKFFLVEAQPTAGPPSAEDDDFMEVDQEEKGVCVLKEWRKHLYEKVLSRKIKSDYETKVSENSTSASFDLQQVLDAPFTNVGDAFYKRSLSCYNFVIHEKSKKKAHCYFWNELDGNRGANEIASCILMFLRQRAEEGIEHFYLTCDNCPGQTRNRQMGAAIAYAVNNIPGVQSVEILFLLKGHTENSADDVHSMIERMKNVTVYTPSEWAVLIRNLRMKDTEVFLNHLTFLDFFDVTAFMRSLPNMYKDEKGDVVVNWSHIKSIKTNAQHGYVLFYSSSYGINHEPIKLLQLSKKRKTLKEVKKIPTVIPKAYTNQMSISSEKGSDLIWMCEKNIIPKRYHNFFQSLKVRKGKQAVEEDGEI